MVELATALKTWLRDVVLFARHLSGIKLREYQKEVARAVVKSVQDHAGRSIVVIFPRQSGKNELQAQIECYLMFMLHQRDTELVKASPTWKPQSLNAMRRLERVLKRNLLTARHWVKESGYIYRISNARIYFLSGSDTANVVGATANTLLQCDEAQDVSKNKWDKDFSPMAASTNATRVFWGTAWTSRTLLAREREAAEQEQAEDGIQRVWILTADDVAEEVPAYGEFVAERIKQLGRNHPMVKTQYFSEEIDAEGGMFPADRIRKMQGSHSTQTKPIDGQLYAMTIDVAGEDEGAIGQDPGRYASGAGIDAESLSLLENPKRDTTCATIFNLDLSTLPHDQKGAPTYKVARRYTWIGKKHTQLYRQLVSIAKEWRCEYIVVDSTGVGAGLSAFLEKSFPGRVIPFLFTSKSKSDLGWQFLAVIETGRFQEPVNSKGKFWQEVEYCTNEVLDGPGRMMKWGVPDGTRDENGDLVHDDELISTALCAVLDDQEWMISEAPVVVNRIDPLMEMDSEGF